MGELNQLIHQPIRLRIMSALSVLDRGETVDFTFLKKKLKLTDGNLGMHLMKLEEAQYIQVEKTFVARRPKTFICLTHTGREAFNEHIRILKSILPDT
jgi:DNA-binding MarR family transcriptional regulator